MTVGELLQASLLAAGVYSVYGPALPGVTLGLAVDDPDLARLLAAADERVHGDPVALHLGDGRLRIGSGTPAARVTVDRPSELAGAIDDGVEIVLDLDLDAPAGADVDPPWPRPRAPWVDVDPDVVDAIAAAPSLLFLAGPGVLRARAEDGLRSLAAVTSTGVLNTWGAKGVFYWRSRHHVATIGLQAGDFTDGGLADVDLIVSSGLDPLEAPRERWDLAPATIDIPPGMLAPLSELAAVARPYRDIEFPPVRARLGAATAQGWDAGGPLPAPSALTRRYSQRVGPRGLVAADPGTAGFFVARTLPTEWPRTVAVPAEGDAEGFAVAAAIVAQLRSRGRRCLAVVDAPVGPRTAALLDVAAGLDIGVDLEVWSPDAVDLTQLDVFVEAAGEIVAWR